VEAAQVARLHRAHVAAEVLDRLDLAAGGERAARVEVGVEADDRVARALQERDHDGADVAEVAGDEDAHGRNGSSEAIRSPGLPRSPAGAPEFLQDVL